MKDKKSILKSQTKETSYKLNFVSKIVDKTGKALLCRNIQFRQDITEIELFKLVFPYSLTDLKYGKWTVEIKRVDNGY